MCSRHLEPGAGEAYASDSYDIDQLQADGAQESPPRFIGSTWAERCLDRASHEYEDANGMGVIAAGQYAAPCPECLEAKADYEAWLERSYSIGRDEDGHLFISVGPGR